MASTSAAFVLQDRQDHIIAPDDSDFLDSDAESSSTPHPDDQLIEEAVLQGFENASPQRSSRNAAGATSANKLWPAHPLIRIHKRLWFTWFNGDLPSEDDLNEQDGLPPAWKNFDDAEVKKYIDPTETNPSRLHWFNIDHDLVYLSFWFDWGPLNVGMFYRFCLHVHHMLTDPQMHDATLVLYTTNAPAQKANAALLVTLYAMIIGKVTPADAFYPISELEFKPFRDAGYGRADYNLSIQDILYGVHRAINSGLLDLTTFNLDEYEKYEQVSHGDWNWITPNFIAFASPNDRNYVEALRVGEGRLPASYSFRPPGEDKLFGKTIRYFKDRGVKLVVRLNNPLYDREAFLNVGIDHSDMYFDDGSNPTDEILADFIAKADHVIAHDGVVAVHCKAGLGRTGVLIGAYLVWKHGFSAGEAIGFMRFMRPGCVVGPQQHFMYQNFAEWIKWGVRDHAMKEARQLIAEERTKLEAATAAARAAAAAAEAANAATAAVALPMIPTTRASTKRRAAGSDAAKCAEADRFDQPDADVSLDEHIKHAPQLSRNTRRKPTSEHSDSDDDEGELQRPRQKRKSAAAAAAAADYIDGSGPVTPIAQRASSRAVPASAAPVSKPAPCVGQPRKSPSPSRKRPAIQAPATVARLELNGRRYPTATRSFNHHLMLNGQSVHVDAVNAGVDVVQAVDQDAHCDDADQEKTGASGGVVAAASNAGVLVESRINISSTATPRSSPKAAVVNLTPSPVARVRGFERSRSNTIATATMATPVRGSSRPDSAVKPEVFRASPNIRDRYGLRDSSHSPPPAATATATSRMTVSRQASPVKAETAPVTDAEVLGVIDCIPQPACLARVSTRRPSPSPSPVRTVAKAGPPTVATMNGEKAPSRIALEQDVENVQPGTSTAAVVHRAPLTKGVVASTSTVGKVVRAVKSKAVLSNGVCSARVTTARKPISARRDLGETTQRSVSARLAPRTASTATVRLRAPKSTADLRAAAATSTRSVSSASNSSTVATTGARPASRLTAPTAASAARAAATASAAKRALPLRPLKPTCASARNVSSALHKSATPSTAVRRRRSSTGEAGLDVAA